MPDPLTPIGPVAPPRAGAPAPAARARSAGPASFAGTLAAEQARAPRFSAHAQQRLSQRGIELAPADLSRLTRAVDQASARGGQESLILLDELALIVSINNRTVITAMDATSQQGSVFTNVDSVVIAPPTRQ
jgi:flagellar operon protein